MRSEDLSKYREIINAMNDTVWVIDFDEKFIDVNDTAIATLGYTREELLRMGPADIDAFLTEGQILSLAHSMPLDKMQVFETVHVTKEGKKIPVEVSSSIINYEGEKRILSIARDITQRKKAEEEIMHQLEEKEILLKEVHHRIKNNLASIEGLLLMQSKTMDNAEARGVLKDAFGYVKSIRMIYDKLLFSSDYHDLSIKEYLNDLLDTIEKTFPQAGNIYLEREIDDFDIDVKLLFPLGVIVNELITNAMKYAFPNGVSGHIKVLFKREKNTVRLVVHDDGCGLPHGPDNADPEGFGLSIVRILSEQLEGCFTIEDNHGTCSTVTFEL